MTRPGEALAATLEEPRFYAGNPFPHYARLRREAPVAWNPQLGYWAVSTHADVMTNFEALNELRRVAGNLDRNKAEIDRALQVLPIKLNKVGRTAIYGSWFNFYLCNFKARVNLPGGQTVPINYNTGGARCNLG